jgi:hypothetical protein
MNLDELRERRRARRARRHAGGRPWGTVSLVLGAAGFAGIYGVARTCSDIPKPDATQELLVDVTAVDVRVAGRVVARVGDAAAEERLVERFAQATPGSRVVIRGAPGVTFARLQQVQRAAARAGLAPPRLVPPKADLQRE